MTSFVAYAVVMVPLMIVFAFEVGQSWAPGVPGLFVGMTCGSATHAALNLLLALRWTDFEKASEIAYERANAAAAKDDEQAAGRVDAPAPVYRKVEFHHTVRSHCAVVHRDKLIERFYRSVGHPEPVIGRL